MIKTRNKKQSFFGYIWQCLEYTNLKFVKHTDLYGKNF